MMKRQKARMSSHKDNIGNWKLQGLSSLKRRLKTLRIVIQNDGETWNDNPKR